MSTRDLNRYIVEQQAAQWERLIIRLELGLKDYHVANISKDNPNRSETCYREMLQKWLNIDPSASCSKLDDAVKKIKSQTGNWFTVQSVIYKETEKQ